MSASRYEGEYSRDGAQSGDENLCLDEIRRMKEKRLRMLHQYDSEDEDDGFDQEESMRKRARLMSKPKKKTDATMKEPSRRSERIKSQVVIENKSLEPFGSEPVKKERPVGKVKPMIRGKPEVQETPAPTARPLLTPRPSLRERALFGGTATTEGEILIEIAPSRNSLFGITSRARQGSTAPPRNGGPSATSTASERSQSDETSTATQRSSVAAVDTTAVVIPTSSVSDEPPLRARVTGIYEAYHDGRQRVTHAGIPVSEIAFSFGSTSNSQSAPITGVVSGIYETYNSARQRAIRAGIPSSEVDGSVGNASDEDESPPLAGVSGIREVYRYTGRRAAIAALSAGVGFPFLITSRRRRSPVESVAAAAAGSSVEPVSTAAAGTPDEEISTDTAGILDEEVSTDATVIPDEELSNDATGIPDEEISDAEEESPLEAISTDATGIPDEEISTAAERSSFGETSTARERPLFAEASTATERPQYAEASTATEKSQFGETSWAEEEERSSSPDFRYTQRSSNIYGPIPDVEVGHHWKSRMECSQDGVHRPTVAGIHPGPMGAYSIALSGGYPEDIDEGHTVIFTGAGGRDLQGTTGRSRSVSHAPQVKDQILSRSNWSLIRSSETGMPVRVIRGYKMNGEYAPEFGYRYDGLYKVVEYCYTYGYAGYGVYRFRLCRMEGQGLAPWEIIPRMFCLRIPKPRRVPPVIDGHEVEREIRMLVAKISQDFPLYVDGDSDGWTSVAFRADTAPVLTLKPHSTPATLLWLDRNYELADGICIPRNTLYSHYVHFCRSNSMNPLNSASFGKIIRQAFPSLTTRRLGTRGQSRYHYYGIAIKDSSPYYDIAFSKMNVNCSETKKLLDKNDKSVALTRNKVTSTVLPQFPNMKEISFPPHVSKDKVTSFILMYHTHCQRIFDTIIRGTLDEAYQFLQHFWQGVPSHLTSLLNTNTVVNMVGVCDSILYRTISSVLMPNVFKRCSEGLIQMVRTFADKLENWIHAALCDVPINLKTVKLKLGRSFCTILRRQMALYQLTHTAQVVLNNYEIMGHIHKDWKRINLEPISKQALFFTEYSNDHVETIKYISNYWENFQDLIERKATIEDFTEKVENTVHSCVVEMSQKKRAPLRRVAKTFILLWHAVGSLISRDMTIHSAVSFGSFHLIQTMFDEYIHYLVEILHSEDVTKYLLKNVALDVLPNLDFTWNGITETNCFDLCDTPTLPSLTDVPDDLESHNEFNPENNQPFFQSAEYDFGANQNPNLKYCQQRSDNNYINNDFGYCNTKDTNTEGKYNNYHSNTESGSFQEFNGCNSQCVEFSTGVYYQETLQYATNNSFFQSSVFDETTGFGNLD